MYHFIQSMAGQYAVATMCRLLAGSRSAYYQWLQAGKEKEAGEKKKERIVTIFQEHQRRYGVRRIVVELQAGGIAAGAYQVRKVLQDKGLRAIQPRSFVPRTTDSTPRIPSALICCWNDLHP